MDRKPGHLTKSVQEIAGSLFWIKVKIKMASVVLSSDGSVVPFVDNPGKCISIILHVLWATLASDVYLFL